MTLAAITGFEISLFLHITAAVVGFGATFAESIMFPVALKAGTRHMPYVHRLQRAINTWLATPALVVVLATGLYQTEEGGFDYSEAWLSASMAIIIVLGGLIGAYFIPSDRKLEMMVARDLQAGGGGDAPLSDEYQRRARIQGMFGALAGLLVVVAVFLMVVKPGA